MAKAISRKKVKEEVLAAFVAQGIPAVDAQSWANATSEVVEKDATDANLRIVAANGLAGLREADAATEAVTGDICATLGAELAAADAVAGDFLGRLRAEGLIPAVQGDDESGDDYDKRCEAFTPDKARMAAFMDGYIRNAKLTTRVTLRLFVENETTGLCRDAVEGDNPSRVREFTPLDCYVMPKEVFKALPGDRKSPDYERTIKGRVGASREGMQGIGHNRVTKLRGEARESGRRVEAATGVPKSGGGRGRNKSFAANLAKFGASSLAHWQAQGGDKGMAWRAAFGGFVDDLMARGLLDRDAWTAAQAEAKAAKAK